MFLESNNNYSSQIPFEQHFQRAYTNARITFLVSLQQGNFQPVAK